MLKLMCRKQSDEAAFIYKPLGVLKRNREHRPTYDSESDDELFDGLDLGPVRKKMGLQKEKTPETTAVCVEESLPLTITNTQAAGHNYVDCTESNDEEDDEEEECDEGKGDVNVMEEGERKQPENVSSQAPKWEDFFTTETLTDSQNSLKSQSQSCCSEMTGSVTPELFSDEEAAPDGFSLTLSASLSNHSSQNMDSYLPDTLILQPGRDGQEQGDTRTSETQKEVVDDVVIQSELEEQSESQLSSDFDIPCTPESKAPRPDELSQLYRKLASGEDVRALDYRKEH